jgi:OOP family OmpA-OmpF porin
MRRPVRWLAAIAAVLILVPPAFAAPNPAYLAELQKDLPGASDHPLAGRYEGSSLLSQTVKAFDELSLPSGPAEGETWDQNKKFPALQTAEGRVTRSLYVVPPGRSVLEIARNFKTSLAGKGFEPVFECAGEACGKSFRQLKYSWDRETTQVVPDKLGNARRTLVKAMFDGSTDLRYGLYKRADAGGETFIAVFVAGHQGGTFGDVSDTLEGRTGVLIESVEPRAMEQRITTVSSAEIDSTIAAQGRVSLYGIYFDFDRADIKPESEPQLAEMAKFLKGAPDLRIHVLGHTDNRGKLDYNLSLSQRRAEAVAKALSARYGVDPKRMAARGLGSLAPVASNRTEGGQAKNRRVELVEQ